MKRISYLDVLRLRGTDTRRFLHNQLSADIQSLQSGEASFACLCHPKGRVIALLLVQITGDGALLGCASALSAAVTARLGMFVLRDDVHIDRPEDLAVLAGPADSSGSEPALANALPGLAYALAPPGSAEADAGAWKAAELERGVAWLNAATSEQFLPQMLGYEGIGALNFRKGCFPGQEIIARTRYLGKLKQRALVADTNEVVDLKPMTALELHGEEQMAEAKLVDLAPIKGGTRLLLVARTAEEFAAEQLRIGARDVTVAPRWLRA